MYISPTAVMKQMNTLEKNLDLTDYRLHLVPFEDNHEEIVSEIKNLGEKFDFLVGVCDSKIWLSICNFLPLGRYKKMVAVSRDHRLASKDCIELEDLYGENLMMVARGDSGNVLLSIECWKDVHPGLVSIPMNWDYSIPYGILYSKDAPDDVKEFVRLASEIVE